MDISKLHLIDLDSCWGQHKYAKNALFGQFKDHNSGSKKGN